MPIPPPVRKVPALPDASVPVQLEDGTMNPIWRQFWIKLLAEVEELREIVTTLTGLV